MLLVKYEKGCVRSLREVTKILAEDYGIKLSPSSVYRRLIKNSEEEKEATLLKNKAYKNLLRQYDEGIIQTQKQLRDKVKEATGVTLSMATLSRHLKLLTGNERRKREEAHGSADIPSSSTPPTCREMLGTTSCEVKYRSLSRRLNSTILTIGEQGGVRQYRRLSVSSDGTKEYFRCIGCYRSSHKNGGGMVAHLTVHDGRIVSSAHPQHHENCRLVSEEKAAIQALDRQSRKDVRTGKKAPRDAHAVGFERVVQLAESCGGPPGRTFSMPAMYPSWNRVRRSYYRARRYALSQNEKTMEEDPIATERYMHPSEESSIRRADTLKRENSFNEEEEATDTVSQLPSSRKVVSRSMSTESIKVDDSCVVDDTVGELLVSVTPEDCRSPSLVDDDEPISVDSPEKSFQLSGHQTPSTPANVSISQHMILEEDAGDATSHSLAENASTSGCMVRKNLLVNGKRPLLLENSSTYSISPSEPCTSNSVSVVASKIADVPSTTSLAQSVRRHILTRDPRTGRIVVKQRAAPDEPPVVTVPNRRTLTLSTRAVKAKSTVGHRTAQADDGYKHAELKRKATTVSPESQTETHISDSVQLSKPRATITLDSVLDSMVPDSMQLPLCSPASPSRSDGARTRQFARCSGKSAGGFPEVETGLNKARSTPQDQYDKIGSSVADSLRRVCEEDVGVGVKFKCELLQIMAKYETMAFAK
ncbi:unnamed protein product [Toxocara canis]|nr:unnamed protein product [Toxocara canis]